MASRRQLRLSVELRLMGSVFERLTSVLLFLSLRFLRVPALCVLLTPLRGFSLLLASCPAVTTTLLFRLGSLRSGARLDDCPSSLLDPSRRTLRLDLFRSGTGLVSDLDLASPEEARRGFSLCVEVSKPDLLLLCDPSSDLLIFSSTLSSARCKAASSRNLHLRYLFLMNLARRFSSSFALGNDILLQK